MEENFLSNFKGNFMNNVMPAIAEKHLCELAGERSIRNNTTQDEELQKLEKEYRDQGPYPFTFDSGTTPAVKQLRQKLLLAGCGAINLAIDEIGSNLLNNIEILNTYLELYDKGYVKAKLTKHTAESKRGEEIDGSTPANMLLFGTPAKIFDGGLTEDAFYSFLEIGYARRCLFGVGHVDKKALYSRTPAEIFYSLIDPGNQDIIDKWACIFANLAQEANFGRKLRIEDSTSIELIAYKTYCEQKADALPDHEEIQKAELSHRYFKALKLAGCYAFIDGSLEVTLEHIKQAIKLTEESGAAFKEILVRERPYMKLAKYLASIPDEVTHADLNAELPYYKTSIPARNELISMARAWGYKNNIIIKRSFLDDIEFFSADKLEETDLGKIMFSVSTDIASGYETMDAPWNQMYKLVTAPNLNWCNHSFKDGHRARKNVIPGFNLVAIDIDQGTSIETAKELLKEYCFLIYETKRNTPENNRFRILMPINYVLELDAEDYREFIQNILDWLPFKDVDSGSKDPERKWLTCETGNYYYNDGKLLDALKFIPKTSRNEAFKKEQKSIKNVSNLERWLLASAGSTGRNNTLAQYAFALIDQGLDQKGVEDAVLAFNKRFSEPLTKDEIKNTIFVSIAKRFSQ